MARRSTVKALPPEVRRELDRILTDGHHTLDQIVEHLRRLGAPVSRSALGRYSQEFEAMLADIRLTREMAAAVGRELSDLADGDATEMLVESLQALLLKARKQLIDGEEIRAKDVADLARAVKDLATALRTKADLVAKIREEAEKNTKSAAAKAAEAVARERGLSADTAAALKSQILGVKVGG